MPKTLLLICNHFVRKARPGGGITPTALQRLAHIAFGWHAANTRTRLFESKIYAGPFGPLIPDLDERLQVFRNKSIVHELPLEPTASHWRITASPEIRELLDAIWREYGHLSENVLSKLTRVEGSPWSQARRDDPRAEAPEILLERFTAHYQILARRVG